jgi:hypothetical protein
MASYPMLVLAAAAFHGGEKCTGGGRCRALPSPCLATDVSDLHLGGVMLQCSNCPGAVGAAQKLSEADSRYSTFDRELLATFSAILHF